MTSGGISQDDAPFRSCMSFGRKIEGREITQNLGPEFFSRKANVKFLGGRLNDQLEAQLDIGLEALFEKAKSKGGNGVINVGFRITESSPYYMMWGDAVILKTDEDHGRA